MDYFCLKSNLIYPSLFEKLHINCIKEHIQIINKTAKRAFTYNIVTEGDGVSKMLTHDYGGGGGWWGGS